MLLEYRDGLNDIRVRYMAWIVFTVAVPLGVVLQVGCWDSTSEVNSSPTIQLDGHPTIRLMEAEYSLSNAGRHQWLPWVVSTPIKVNESRAIHSIDFVLHTIVDNRGNTMLGDHVNLHQDCNPRHPRVVLSTPRNNQRPRTQLRIIGGLPPSKDAGRIHANGEFILATGGSYNNLIAHLATRKNMKTKVGSGNIKIIDSASVQKESGAAKHVKLLVEARTPIPPGHISLLDPDADEQREDLGARPADDGVQWHAVSHPTYGYVWRAELLIPKDMIRNDRASVIIGVWEGVEVVTEEVSLEMEISESDRKLVRRFHREALDAGVERLHRFDSGSIQRLTNVSMQDVNVSNTTRGIRLHLLMSVAIPERAMWYWVGDWDIIEDQSGKRVIPGYPSHRLGSRNTEVSHVLWTRQKDVPANIKDGIGMEIWLDTRTSWSSYNDVLVQGVVLFGVATETRQLNVKGVQTRKGSRIVGDEIDGTVEAVWSRMHGEQADADDHPEGDAQRSGMRKPPYSGRKAAIDLCFGDQTMQVLRVEVLSEKGKLGEYERRRAMRIGSAYSCDSRYPVRVEVDEVPRQFDLRVWLGEGEEIVGAPFAVDVNRED